MAISGATVKAAHRHSAHRKPAPGHPSHGKSSGARSKASAKAAAHSTTIAAAPTIDRASHGRAPFDSPLVIHTVSQGENIARTALAYRGATYRFGGRSAQSGFDCSGLVQTVCAKWGVYLPRMARAQFTRGVHVTPANLKAGDLVFFKGTYKPGLSHVGIFIGEGQFIHAAGVHKGVRISRLSDAYYQHHWAGARRFDLKQLPKAQAEYPVLASDVIVDRPGETSEPVGRAVDQGDEPNAELPFADQRGVDDASPGDGSGRSALGL
jgi:cell wall-associated NlpC family hydrolase